MRKEGFIFRRQHPIDFFIADFYCHKIKLVIEVDGEIHQKLKIKEFTIESLSGELDRLGIRVIRFRNYEIFNNLDLIMIKIKNT